MIHNDLVGEKNPRHCIGRHYIAPLRKTSSFPHL